MTAHRAILILLGFAAGTLLPSSRCAGADFGQPPPPKTPEESLAAIVMRPGMRVELMAAEPLVMDPIDIAWGPDGKLWVVEMADYPMGIDGNGKPGGRVRFLEDTDGDGKYDRSTLFAEGLNYPTGVMPWRDGVLVTAAPEILYIPDATGDGVAEEREVLFDGFIEGNQQHRVNGLRWGLDNWIYIANGDSGGLVGVPERPEPDDAQPSGRIGMAPGDRVNISGRDLRMRPDDHVLEVQSGRTQYGRNRDDWGNWFGCSNSRPMWHFLHADHYLRRNPHLAPPPATEELVERAARVYPVSETVARFNRPESANRFTSACGTMIYRDNLLGEEFAGNAFIAEPVHNLVHRRVLTREGVTFLSARAEDEAESEFFASTDPWSRPVAIKTGPDGALWIIDMYRAVIEHPQWIPDDWEAQLDLRAGEDKGRIYRVYPEGVEPRPIARLDGLAGEALLAALDSPNGWQRDMVHQLMVGEIDPFRYEESDIAKIATDGANPLARLHALCVLDGLDRLGAPVVRSALRDPHPGVRRQAVRLSERLSEASPGLIEPLAALTDDPDPAVRMQLAYSLGEWWRDPATWDAAGDALWKLWIESESPDMEAAVLSSSVPHRERLIDLATAKEAHDDRGVALARELLVMTVRLRMDAETVLLLERLIDDGDSSRGNRFATVADFFDALSREKLSLRSLQAGKAEPVVSMLAKLDAIVDEARGVLGDGNAPAADRAAAAHLLGRGLDRQGEDIDTLAQMLAPGTPVELQLAIVASMGKLGRSEIPSKLLERWGGFGPAVRRVVLDVVFDRAPWIEIFLAEAEQRPELVTALDATRRQSLIQHPAKAVRERAQKVIGREAVRSREGVLHEYGLAVAVEGDVEKGKALFAAACASCHQLGGVGRSIGPDLSALTDKSAMALLVAIVDPNRAVEDKYIQYIAVTKDDRTLAGLVVEESGNSVTLLGADGVPQVVLGTDLKSFTSTERSMMPEGLEVAIDVGQMADLIRFVAESGGEGAER